MRSGLQSGFTESFNKMLKIMKIHGNGATKQFAIKINELVEKLKRSGGK